MSVGYLLPAEYVAYGLSAETPDDVVTMASAVIEAHCRRVSLGVTQYVERLRMTAGAQTVRLSYGPLSATNGTGGGTTGAAALVQVRVRYARPRRGEIYQDPYQSQIAYAFGLPGSWSVLNSADVDVNSSARELTFIANVLGLDYNEAEVTYTAGFVTIPVAVKAACALIVKNALATPAMNVKTNRLDTMQMTYFSGSLLDEQVLGLLRPYVAERLG